MLSKLKNFIGKGAKSTTGFPDLYEIPQLPCNTSSLPCASDIDIDAFIHSDANLEAWENVQATIKALDLPEYTGGVNLGDQRAIFYLAYALKPKNILEVGTHIGCSTLHFALAMKHTGTPGKLTTVDIRDVNDPVKQPWVEYKSPASPQDLLEKIECRDMVSFVTGNSIEFMNQTDQRFDLIFLDGSHLPHDVYQELPAALKILSPKGVILLHDYFPNGQALWEGQNPIMGPVAAMDRFVEEGNPLEVVPFGDLPWPTKLGTNTTSLAILGKTC